jgi:site-specific DNA recombinase
VAAPELEQAVLAVLRSILADQAGLVAGIEHSAEIEQILGMISNWRERLGDEDEARVALVELIKRVQLTGTGLRVTVTIPIASVGAGASDGISLSHFVPMSIRRRGVELRLILDGKADQQRQVDPALLKALARARSWFEEVATGRVASLAAIARRERLRKRYVTRLTKLAFVAPPIAEAIAAGCTPTGVNLQMLMDGRLELAHCWFEQQRMFSGVNSLC